MSQVDQNKIIFFQNIAKERGGQLLSDIYLGAHIKLLWICNNNHEWLATPNNIKKGSWCPNCCTYLSESICKLIFESIFKENFIKVRPDWLKNPITKRSLELDGYCEKLNIAFEYNGEHHYDDSFFSRSKYDQLKISTCNQKQIKLYIIKDNEKLSSIKKVDMIIDQIKSQSNIIMPNFEFDINQIFRNKNANMFFDKIKKIAKDKNGECLSEQYLGIKDPLNFKCEFKHEWSATPDSILQDRWCRICAYLNHRSTIEQMNELASNKGGRFLSQIYEGDSIKHKWQCQFQHEWLATPSKIKQGRWCPECYLLKLKHKK